MSTDNTVFRAAARKRRAGCLGCLGQAILGLLLGVVLITAMTEIFYPWAFYLGGSFHIVPYWQGWGRAHTKSGDYLVWVQFEPTPHGSRMYPESNLTGRAYVCTSRGEELPMHLGGGMPKHLKRSTDGEPIHLYMNYWPWNGTFMADHRPSLEFRGHWKNPDLVMDDHGSIGRAFQPDGTVYRSHNANRPYIQDIVPITFVSGSYSNFNQACATARK